MDHACQTCSVCRLSIEALDKRMGDNLGLEIKRLEGLMGEKTSRLEERYVNQRDYNKQHNDLQREMKEQAKDTMSTKEFETWKDRIVKLERWPWLGIGLFTILQGVIVVMLKVLGK